MQIRNIFGANIFDFYNPGKPCPTAFRKGPNHFSSFKQLRELGAGTFKTVDFCRKWPKNHKIS